MRHNNIRDFEANLLKKVCNDVEVEPPLQPINGETFTSQVARGDESRLDIRARGFFRHAQSNYFDIRVTNTNAPSQIDKSIATIFKSHEKEKKRKYNERVMNVEHGTFTPLVFSINGGEGPECTTFHKLLADKLSLKTGDRYEKVLTWIRCKISFLIIRSALLCLRGSGSIFSDKQVDVVDYFTIACDELKL